MFYCSRYTAYLFHYHSNVLDTDKFLQTMCLFYWNYYRLYILMEWIHLHNLNMNNDNFGISRIYQNINLEHMDIDQDSKRSLQYCFLKQKNYSSCNHLMYLLYRYYKMDGIFYKSEFRRHNNHPNIHILMHLKIFYN